MATARWLRHVQPPFSYILGPESCSSTFLTVDDSERADAFGWKFIDPDGPNREGTGPGARAQPEPCARPFAHSGANLSRKFCHRRKKMMISWKFEHSRPHWQDWPSHGGGRHGPRPPRALMTSARVRSTSRMPHQIDSASTSYVNVLDTRQREVGVCKGPNSMNALSLFANMRCAASAQVHPAAAGARHGQGCVMWWSDDALSIAGCARIALWHLYSPSALMCGTRLLCLFHTPDAPCLSIS